jgi:hypothetical protein
MAQGRDLQEHLDARLDTIDSRLERVENKLDDHLSRLSRAEASVEWLKGHARIVTTIVLAAAGFIASMWANGLGPK